jgi:hypothetical protein
MAGKLPMGQKELLRGKLAGMVKQGKTTLKTAADIRSRVIEQYRLVKELRLAGISTIHEASPLPKKPVTVRRKLDGTIRVLRDGKPQEGIPLKFIEILSKKEANRQTSDAA